MAANYSLSSQLEAHILSLQQTIQENTATIFEIIDCVITCFQRGNKLILVGNGGSAADAQHIAAEFVNRYRFDRPALPAIALTTDSSILTSISNDSSFDYVFSRQLEALAQQGDLLAALSTSGRSVNILNALNTARAKGVLTVGFTGINGRETMSEKCDRLLVVPSIDTARIQETHAFIWHYICGKVEDSLFQ